MPPPRPYDPPPRPMPSLPPGWAFRAALRLRGALHRAVDRMFPAELAVFDRAFGIAQTQLLGAVVGAGVADALGDAPEPAETLAARTGVHADTLHRAMRALAATGVFTLSRDGRFGHNRLSRALQGGRPSRAREQLLYLTSASNVAAWVDLARTLRDGLSAFERVHGETVWRWFARHPDEQENFAQTMMGFSLVDAPVIAGLYPFREVTRVCDVGGGRGTLLSELLLRHPHLRGVLCDDAGVVESARALLTKRGVIDRVEMSPGSFFDGVPGGCDAYVLKNVLHDWHDAACAKVLAAVRASMPPSARLLVCEMLVARNGLDPLGALSDIQMLVVSSEGRERSEGEYRALLVGAGFAVTRVFEHPKVSVIEARCA